jgi:predicted SprT family Zn-dependent metalloprotease
MSTLKSYAAKVQPAMQNTANRVWRIMQYKMPELRNFDCPEIVMNNRLRSTAGLSRYLVNRVDLGTKFFVHSLEYQVYMEKIILPHELAHQADYNLFGESELACGHGEHWEFIMEKVLNLPANRYHRMGRL